MTGFDKQLRDKILGFNPHLRIDFEGGTMRDYPRLLAQISKNSKIKSVAPYVIGQVLVESEPQVGQSKVAAPWVRGILPELETNITILPHSIIEGKFDVSDQGLVIGSEFARHMDLQVGDRLMIYSPKDLKIWRQSVTNEHARVPTPPEFEVRGIFDVGYYEYNLSFIVSSLSDAQDLYDLSNSVHGLMVMLHDAYEAPAASKEIARVLGPEYHVVTWMQENANILNALVVEKNVMFYLLFFIMIVAALCILSALITFVVQKTREIGMLKALGATDVQVSLLFLSQGALVGALGDLAGYGLGMLALTYRNQFLHLMNRLTGFQLFPSDIYGFTDLPALIVPRDIVLICGSAWLVCILGGVIPAWRAGRLKPVEALRYE
jgi:lipoprotein-releasing system permease protein